MKIWLLGESADTHTWASLLDQAGDSLQHLPNAQELPDDIADALLLCATTALSALEQSTDLRREPRFAEVPLIILLPQATPETRSLAAQAGADDVICTADQASLRPRLQRHVDKWQQLQALRHELQQERKKRQHLESYDPLTGLGNRHYLQQFIGKDLEVTLRAYRNWEHAREDSNPADEDLAFLFLEVDHFRYLNDQYGHSFGDEVLQTIKQCLIEAFRETDTLIRWGDKTFLVISRKANRDSAGRLAERARTMINNSVLSPNADAEVQLSASLGICFYPFLQSCPRQFSWQEVTNIARFARDTSKASGRNAWVAINAVSSQEKGITYDAVVNHTVRNIAAGAIQFSTSFPDYHTLTWPRNSD